MKVGGEELCGQLEMRAEKREATPGARLHRWVERWKLDLELRREL